MWEHNETPHSSCMIQRLILMVHACSKASLVTVKLLQVYMQNSFPSTTHALVCVLPPSAAEGFPLAQTLSIQWKVRGKTQSWVLWKRIDSEFLDSSPKLSVVELFSVSVSTSSNRCLAVEARHSAMTRGCRKERALSVSRMLFGGMHAESDPMFRSKISISAIVPSIYLSAGQSLSLSVQPSPSWNLSHSLFLSPFAPKRFGSGNSGREGPEFSVAGHLSSLTRPARHIPRTVSLP